ncbi:LysR family transcriptional regulator ArgP [Cognatishimia sp. SS12]|uniref:LysR family transcriptional regulator ArgP n=1 Tax=Cognatishimia sp. SS12 TaxID=2979465 RepID=UPI00232E4F69|nr:LysR family transcriptional regulator ArgP [Cognatishimia sp. SS12]MDC0738605.1 LysR family transcriptional regulator ArgP [Cognatishimia sp. SS12]
MKYDYQHLAALASILRHGSFEAAAADLSVTQSAISQRVKALEERVGTLLITRGKPCVGTDAGRRLAAHADHIAALDAHLAQDLGELSPAQGARLRIAVNADSLATWFIKPLAEVDGHLYDLHIDDQDFSVEQLRRGEVAAAVTSHGDAIAGCDSHYLGRLRYIATATPAFMAKHFPGGPILDTLARAPMLRFDEKDALQTHWLRAQFGQELRPPFHSLSSSQGFVDGCLHGLGWGLNPEALVRPHLDSGALVPLLPDAPLETPLYWQTARLMRPALKRLTKAICQTAIKTLPQ